MNIFHNIRLLQTLSQDKNRRYYFLLCFFCTLGLSLFFIFVKSPLPWGWEDYDGYLQLGSLLARGQPYRDNYRIWGYPYFTAFFYYIFGENKLFPLFAHAILNAFIPIFIFKITFEEIDRSTAYIAGALAALLSYTTFFTGTFYPDFLCAFLIIFSMFAFVKAKNKNSMFYFILFALLASFAFQVRPNWVFFFFFISFLYVLQCRFSRKSILQVLLASLIFIGSVLPWIYRGYRLYKYFIPTTTHGVLQLWFTSLEDLGNFNRYFENKLVIIPHAHVPYSSLPHHHSIIELSLFKQQMPAQEIKDVVLQLKTNNKPLTTLDPMTLSNGKFTFRVPPFPFGTTLYYIFTFKFRDSTYSIPEEGFASPFVYIIEGRHLEDIDTDNNFLNIFDIARMTEVFYGSKKSKLPDSYDFNYDSKITTEDLNIAIDALILKNNFEEHCIHRHSNFNAYLYEADKKYHYLDLNYTGHPRIAIPKKFNGKITSIDFSNTDTAKAVMMNSILIHKVKKSCFQRSDWYSVIARPELDEIHSRRRMAALAIENIKNNFPKYLIASGVRLIRLWVPAGSSDISVAIQKSKLFFKIGFIASILSLLATLIGIYLSLKHRMKVLFILAPILYISFTLCWVSVQSRYSLPAQPFTLIFIAIAIKKLMKLS